MIIKIYNWNTKTLMSIWQNIKLEISIDYNIKINSIKYNYNNYFIQEISNKLHKIEVLDLYIESNHIKGFSYQLKETTK